MARFIIRITLHNCKNGEYDYLHNIMANFGYERTIKDSETSVEYDLPSGEYHITSNQTMDKIRDDVKTICAFTLAKTKPLVTHGKVRSHANIVTGPNGHAWYGLERT